MKSTLFIIGAGGHGRVCREIALLSGYKEVNFLDDDEKISDAVGKTSDFEKYIEDVDFFVAIGNDRIRENIMNSIIETGGMVISLRHPDTVISRNVAIGTGTVIMPGAVINTGAEIGDGVIINTSSSVDHDCTVGDFCHIAVDAHLCGAVHVGSHTWIGAGATVSNNISICERCTIGAGAVVIRDILHPAVYAGVPAKRMHSSENDAGGGIPQPDKFRYITPYINNQYIRRAA